MRPPWLYHASVREAAPSPQLLPTANGQTINFDPEKKTNKKIKKWGSAGWPPKPIDLSRWESARPRGDVLTLEQNFWIKATVRMAKIGVSTEVLERPRRC